MDDSKRRYCDFRKRSGRELPPFGAGIAIPTHGLFPPIVTDDPTPAVA